MILGYKTWYEHILKIYLIYMQSCDDVTLLGIITDKTLTFKAILITFIVTFIFIDKYCCKAQYKTHVLRCIGKLLTVENAKILGNAFIDIQFNYISFIWILCKETKISKVHNKILKVVYCKDNFYSNLLLSRNTVYIHQQHLQFLVTRIFESISHINTEFMHSFFKQKQLSYNLRKGLVLNIPSPYNTVQMLFMFEVLFQQKIYLLKLNPAIHFLNLKPFTVILCIFAEIYWCQLLFIPTVNKDLHK